MGLLVDQATARRKRPGIELVTYRVILFGVSVAPPISIDRSVVKLGSSQVIANERLKLQHYSRLRFGIDKIQLSYGMLIRFSWHRFGLDR